MNKRVLKRVCQFLQCQKDNEAHFATFWDKTKDIYPEDQSKTKVKKWLQEHSERFEIIAGKDGNPFGKIRLKTTGRTKDSDGPFTTREEDEQITSRLIETIDKQDGEVLFTVLCAQKSTLFPRQLLDKKYIKKWLIDHNNYFEVLTDVNGGIHSVRVTEEARHRHRGPEVCHKPKPQKWQEVRSVDRVQETSTTLKKVTRFIETNGGSVALCLLVQQKGILPAGVSGNDSVKRFLANFPGQFQLVNTLMQGEMVTLIKSQGSNTKSKKIPSSLQSCDPDIHVQTTQHKGKKACEKKAGALDQVLSFICERGGTVPFAEVLMQASELIDESIDSDDALFFWLSSNASYFEILPSPSGTPYGQVKVKLNIKPRFCHDYVSEKKCSKENCVYLHICKAFVCGVQHCQNTCNRSHDIRSKHNEAILSQSMVLQNCTDQVVCTVLLKSCFPRVCTNYNKNKTGVCPRGEKCNFLHICGDFVLNQCLSCSLSHNIVDGLHNIELLKKYSLLPSKKMSVEMVKTNIAYVQMPKQNDSLPSKDSSEKLTKKNKKSRSRGGKRGKKTTRSSDNTCDFQSDTTSSDEEVPTSRVQQGFSLENHLNTSLSLDQKVESWMSGASGYPPEVYQPTCERSQSISSAEESVQSSTVSSQTSLQLTQTEKKVFMRICTKHDGSALFHQVSKDNDLFPSDFDVRRWFEDHSKAFVLLSNGRGKIERVNAFSRTCRLCLNYPSKRGCSKQDCHYIHMCRNFVEGCCPNGGDCDLNHDFQGNHNKQLAKRFHLDELTDAQLCKLVQLSTPNVCRFYNKGHCNRGVNCPNIHICEKFAKGKCKSGEDCRFDHLKALETGHAKKILEQYQMDKQKPSYIYKMLFVFNEKRTHEAKHDSKGIVEGI